jgi:HSP20 family protein
MNSKEGAMELVPYRNERGIGTFQRQMNRLFDDFFGDGSWPGLWTRSEWTPAIDVSESEEELVVQAEVPGISRDDLEITVTGNTLTLRGEKKEQREEKQGSVHREERSYGSFTRTIGLPSSVDPGRVDAGMKDGVLRIRIAKKEEAKPRQVEVKID